MQIQVRTDSYIAAGVELNRQVESIVEGALSRFGDRITRVEVHLADDNSDEKFGDKDKSCVMEARLAGFQPITASHKGSSLEQALAGAADTLQRTLKRTLGRLDSLSKRRARARAEFSTADPLLQRGAEIGNQEEFLTLLRPLLGHLRVHASRELQLLELSESLRTDQVTTDDLLNEVLARAWLRFAERPREMPLDLWLVKLLDEALDEKIEPQPRVKKSLDQPADEPHSEDLLQVDDQEWWGWLLGEDETITLEDTISSDETSPAAEQPETHQTRELRDRMQALLGAMPKAQRQAFVLRVVEAYELFEIAMLQDRPEREVQADIKDARKTFRDVMK